MKLERVWCIIGVYWSIIFMFTSILPYNVAYLLMSLGYFLSLGSLCLSIIVLAYRRLEPKLKFLKRWWNHGYQN